MTCAPQKQSESPKKETGGGPPPRSDVRPWLAEDAAISRAALSPWGMTMSTITHSRMIVAKHLRQ